MVRQQIKDVFGTAVLQADGSINRKALGEIVFADAAKLAQLNEIMATPILVRLRKELLGKRGLIILNAALLVEAEMSQLANYNMILLSVAAAVQQERLLARGLEPKQIQRRLASQYDFAHKRAHLEADIAAKQQGKLWTLENNGENQQVVQHLFDELVGYFGLSRA